MADGATQDNLELFQKYEIDNIENLTATPFEDGYVVFKCDDSYKELYPEKALKIELYNNDIKALYEKVKDSPDNDIELIEEDLIGHKYDTAFPLLIKKLIPSGRGLQGFMLAAILGAVISSLASMLNSASTIFTMDIYKKYLKKDASQGNLIGVGRLCTVIFVVIGCLIAPILDDPEFGGVFKYIQEFQGYISPGILAVFVFGLLVKMAPPITGIVGLLLNAPLYFLLAYLFPKLAFLDRMAITFGSVLLVMGVITCIAPLKEPKKLPYNTKINLESSRVAKVLGLVVVALTITLYIIFW